MEAGKERHRCRGRRGRLRRRRSTQSSPRRKWRRREAAEEREKKEGSELRVSAGVGDDKVDGRLGGGDGGSIRTRRRDQWRETATSRPWRQQRTASKEMEAADDAGHGRRGDGGGRQETGKEGADGLASAASRRKRLRSMVATASWEGGTGGLMKTEMRPMATEKCEGREDPVVVGDGKEEEGERERQRRRRSLPRIRRQHHGGERRWGLR